MQVEVAMRELRRVSGEESSSGDYKQGGRTTWSELRETGVRISFIVAFCGTVDDFRLMMMAKLDVSSFLEFTVGFGVNCLTIFVYDSSWLFGVSLLPLSRTVSLGRVSLVCRCRSDRPAPLLPAGCHRGYRQLRAKGRKASMS